MSRVEIRSMPLLQEGYAGHFQETLRLTSTAETFLLDLAASGAMTDGRSFWVNYVFRDGVVKTIDIRFE
jgi:hypothetical protein